jgi:hypothetical protein
VRPLADPSPRRIDVARGFADLRIERPIGVHRLVLRSTLGIVHSGENDVPPQYLVYLGGPVSAPGYAYHSLVGKVGFGQRLEWRSPVPFPSLPLGRFGTAPATATLAPYLHLAFIDDPVTTRPLDKGWHPSAGIGALVFFDLVRIDVARGLRDGRWTFSADLMRDLWRVL